MLELGDLFRRKYHKLMVKMSFSREEIVDLQEALGKADDNGDKFVGEEFHNDLMKRGYGDDEIEEILSMPDVDDGGRLGSEVVQKICDFLDGRKIDINDRLILAEGLEEKFQSFRNMRPFLSGNEDIEDYLLGLGEELDEGPVLQRRLDRLEHSMANIMTNISLATAKINDVAEERVKRQSTIAALLDCVGHQIGKDNDTYA